MRTTAARKHDRARHKHTTRYDRAKGRREPRGQVTRRSLGAKGTGHREPRGQVTGSHGDRSPGVAGTGHWESWGQVNGSRGDRSPGAKGTGHREPRGQVTGSRGDRSPVVAGTGHRESRGQVTGRLTICQSCVPSDLKQTRGGAGPPRRRVLTGDRTHSDDRWTDETHTTTRRRTRSL